MTPPAQLDGLDSLYRIAFDQAQALLVLVTETGSLKEWNRCASDVLGWSGLAPNTALATLVHPSSEQPLKQALSTVAKTGVAKAQELTFSGGNGDARVIRFSFVAISTGQPGERCLLGTGQDVTERLLIERKVADAAAIAAMGRLTAGLAHEIRNPLNAAKLQLEILHRYAQRSVGAEHSSAIGPRVETIKGELARLSKLLEEFFNLAQPQRYDFRPIRLDEIVRSVCEGLTGTEAETARVTATWEPDLPHVRADEKRLRYALEELIANALEAVGPDRQGHITVHAGRAPSSERHLELTVVDNGPGIAPEVSQTLFSPFVSTKPSGTGLGLTVVHQIATMHRGGVSVSSDSDQTVAKLSLPIAAEE